MKTRFRPILFSTPMVQSLHIKEMTRRTQGLESVNFKPDSFILLKTFEIKREVYDGKHSGFYAIFNNSDKKEIELKAKFQTGDILWVRETFGYDHHQEKLENVFVYKADNAETTLRTEKESVLPSGEIVTSNRSFWHPSIHMPKTVARNFLEVTNVRIERLHDISSRDAIAEGIEFEGDINDSPSFRNYLVKGASKAFTFGYPYNSFSSLWESINGYESWQSNPWVWVYEFKKIEKPAVWPQ